MATPQALQINASKVYTCLNNVSFGNSRTEDASIGDRATIFGEGYLRLLDSVLLLWQVSRTSPEIFHSKLLHIPATYLVESESDIFL